MKKETRNLQMPPLIESEVTALSALADNGPTSVYQIKKKTGKAYSLMFNAIKRLKKRNMIILVETKQTTKNTKAKIYDLGILGILAVLSKEMLQKDMKEWNYNQIRKIIKKYDNWLPLVFGKWIFFQEAEVESIAFLRLKAILERLNVERTHHFDLFGYDGALVPMADIKTVITWLFYFIGSIPTEYKFDLDLQIADYNQKWIDVFRHDNDVKHFCLCELERFQRRLASYYELGERLKTKIGGDLEKEERKRED